MLPGRWRYCRITVVKRRRAPRPSSQRGGLKQLILKQQPFGHAQAVFQQKRAPIYALPDHRLVGPALALRREAARRPPARRSGRMAGAVGQFARVVVQKAKARLRHVQPLFPRRLRQHARAPPRAGRRRCPENRRIRPAPRPAPCCALRKGRRSAPCESRAHSDAPRSMPPQSPRCRPATVVHQQNFAFLRRKREPARPDTPRCIFPPDKTESPRSAACRSLPPGGNSGLSTAPFCAIINDVCIIAYCLRGRKER